MTYATSASLITTNFLTLEVLLSIIGIIIAIWGVLYIRQARFYYLEKNNIKLYEDIVENIEGLSIKYNDNDIKENLRFYRGTVILRSHLDVKKEDIDTELSIYSSNPNAKWMHFEVTKSSEGFKPEFKMIDNKVLFEKTLLKQNDYFSFSGLLDSNDGDLNVGHRILNVPAGSIKLKERDLISYKRWIQYSPITIFLAILAFTAINPNKTNSRDSKKTIKNYTKEDSLYAKSIEYDKEFYLNNKLINIDSLEKIEIQKETQSIRQKVDSNVSNINGLIAKVEESPSDTNKIKLLRKTVDLLSIELNPLNNVFTNLRSKSTDTLLALLEHNKVDSLRQYLLNDSITVRFSPNILFNTFTSGIGPTYYISTFLMIIAFSMICFMLVLTVIFAYKYYILRKLMKAYKEL